MFTFEYKARDVSGGVVAGVITAAGEAEAATQLFNLGLEPIKLRPQSDQKEKRSFRAGKTGASMSRQERLLFANNMSSLVKAGMPISDIFRLLRDGASTKGFGLLMTEFEVAISAGQPMWSVVEKHPELFSEIWIGTIKAAEESGGLEDAFAKLAAYAAKDDDLRAKIKKALSYPAMCVIAVIIAIVILGVFVIPQFQSVFKGVQLPLLTRVLFGASEFLINYGVAAAVAVVALGYGAVRWINTTGKPWWHKTVIKLPIAGPIVHKAAMARWANSFALSFSSGITMPVAITSSALAMGNVYLGDKIAKMRAGLERGESLDYAASVSGAFQPIVLGLIKAGVATGMVDTQMNIIATEYDKDVQRLVEKLGPAVEAVLTVALGVIVLILALGIMLPMWDLKSALKSH